jgi:hypothetical protein
MERLPESVPVMVWVNVVLVNATPMLPMNSLFPAYKAVNNWLAPGRPLTVSVATPELNVAVPRAARPSKNITVPVGAPLPGAAGLTLAVRVTEGPNLELLGAVRLVVLKASLTLSVTDAVEVM